MPASNNLSNTFYKFDVLLDIGSHTNTFSYLDGDNLGVEIGDIVSVRLKGRLLNGLTISKNPFLKTVKNKNLSPRLKKLKKSLLIKSPFQKKQVQSKTI